MVPHYYRHLAEGIIPDAKEVFAHQVLSIEDVREECVVAVDTNVLLYPFTASAQSFGAMCEVFRSLAEERRLCVPAQVAREFARNRPSKVKDLFGTISKLSEVAITLPRYPLFEGMEEFEALNELGKEISGKLEEYRSRVRRLKKTIRHWRVDDPVSEAYRSIFAAGVVLKDAVNHAEAEEEYDVRLEYGIPPGYKDRGKDDNGIGDYLIWRELLELGRRRKDHLVFVSGDRKGDWWHRSEKTLLSPRWELIQEYRQASGGCSFHIVQLSELLSIFGVADNIIREVEVSEADAERSIGGAGAKGVRVVSVRVGGTRVERTSICKMAEMVVTMKRDYGVEVGHVRVFMDNMVLMHSEGYPGEGVVQFVVRFNTWYMFDGPHTLRIVAYAPGGETLVDWNRQLRVDNSAFDPHCPSCGRRDRITRYPYMVGDELIKRRCDDCGHEWGVPWTQQVGLGRNA